MHTSRIIISTTSTLYTIYGLVFFSFNLQNLNALLC